MPRKKRIHRGQKASGVERRGRPVLISVTLALSLIGACTLLVYSGALKSGASDKKTGPEPSVLPASFDSNSSSKEYVYAGGRLVATEEPCPGDTQPPTFLNCPAINVAAAFACPYASSAVVNYANLVASDNCSIRSVVCSPPSGSTFQLGLTTVTCTATDTSNNTATCSFRLTVFSAGLIDDTNTGNVVLFNTSGDYYFCCGGVPAASGRGTITVSGCNVTIHHVKGDRTVDISVSGSSSGNGSATIQNTRHGVICQINDSRMAGDACACP